MYIDSHCHLTHDKFDPDREDVLERAREAGIEAILTIGVDPDDAKLARDLAHDKEMVYASAGMHPHEALHYNSVALARILQLANEEKVIAIGEIGLDYHYDHSPRDKQKTVFRELTAAALQVNRPVIIHTREAEDDTVRILEEEGKGELRGVIHSFTGSMEMMQRCVELGFYIGLNGIVTFPRSEDLQEVVREIPAGRILIETDAPYLSPAPHRGRRNEPARVVDVCRTVAEIRGVQEETIARRTRENFRDLFGID